MKLLFLTIVFFMANLPFGHQLPIKGRWINNNDSKSVILVTKSKYIETYDRDTIYVGNYLTGIHSCDNDYFEKTSAQKLDFIKVEDGRCFEIVGLTSNRLSLRYTTSGRVQVFRKLKSL
jgi:hypothetical protein